MAYFCRQVDLIGAASGLGARDHGCQDGPDVLKTLGFLRDLEVPSGPCAWLDIVHAAAEPDGHPLWHVATVAQAVADRVADSLQRGHFPLVIGGDHSAAIGTWSGTQMVLQAQGRLGLLWIDAHMDSHTFRTTPSQAIHGMPLACLLGEGDPLLTGVGGRFPKLHPEDVCLLCVRSYESAEAAFLAKLGVKVIEMPEVHRIGFAAAFEEAWAHVGRYSSHAGISLDLDALDPEEEPGVGSPVPEGLHRAELISMLDHLKTAERLVGLEIMEYNPYRDRGFVTAQTIHDVCAAVVS